LFLQSVSRLLTLLSKHSLPLFLIYLLVSRLTLFYLCVLTWLGSRNHTHLTCFHRSNTLNILYQTMLYAVSFN
jgi:hypothetical protein